MKYVHRFGTGSYNAFRVSHADFTGEAFSAPPFEGEVSEDAWLQTALQIGTVALMPNRGTTHAVWHVTTVGAEVILASPGDYIVKPDNDDNLYVCHGPLWEMLTEPVVKDEFSLDDKIKEILKAAAEEMRYGHEIDWSAFMAKLNRDVEALVPVTRGIGNFYRDEITNNDVAETYPAGKGEFTRILGEHFEEGITSTLVNTTPAKYGREQWRQDKAIDTINTLRSMLDNDDVSFDAVQAYQDLSWAKYILLDKAPADLKLITDKCLTLGLVDMLPTCGNNENDAKKAMVALSAHGILGACNDHYRMGLDRHGVNWEKVRWGMAWAKLITGDPVGGEVEDPTYKALAERAAVYREANKVDDPKNLKEAMGLDTDEEVRAHLSMEVVDKARQLILRTASEEVVDWKELLLKLEYAGQMLKDNLPADFDNIVTAVKHMIKTTPGEATLEEVCDYFQGEIVQKRLNDWCDRVHLAYLRLDPTKLTDWRGFLNEVHEIIGDEDPERLPLAWLKTYGTVAAMAKQVQFMQPGPDELSSLNTAKSIGQTLVNQVVGKKDK